MDDLTQSIIDTLRKLRDRVVWRPGKAEDHVRRRIDYGHLPESATLDDYKAIIGSVVANHDADVYAYRYGDAAYAVAVARIEGNCYEPPLMR